MSSQEKSTDCFALPLTPDPKKIKLTISGKCITCQTDKPSDKLRKGKESSLHTLLKSANLRQDKVFERVFKEDHSNIEVYWHANCYSTYTSSHNIQYASTSCADSDRETEESEDIIGIGRFSCSSKNPTDWSKCFICKKRTYQKVRELITLSTFEACDIIKKAAEHQGDEEMLHILRNVNDDLVADAKYKICFSLYIAKKGKSLGTDKDSQYETAFQELAEDLTPGIKQGKAYDMASLLTSFREILNRRGIGSESYTKQHLKSRIEKHFGALVQ